MSSRNLRNMIQVRSGSRSISVESPLSLRMMSRADLMRLPSCCAVVCGCASFALFVRAILHLCSIEQGLELIDRLHQPVLAAEVASDLDDGPVCADGRHFEHVGQDELGRAVLRVLVEQFVEDLARLGAMLVEELLPFAPKALRPLPPGPKGRIESKVADEIERVGLGLARHLRQLI